MTLPEFLTEETEQTILARMLDRIPDDIDKAEGSYIYDPLASTAAEIAQIKIDLQEFLARGFASTTFEGYLDLRCEERGLTRRLANPSTGSVTFTGAPGTVISKGTVVATPADRAANTASIEFQTIAEVVLPAQGLVNADIQALEAGADGNVRANTITVLSTPVSGIASVTNSVATGGGTDIENDASLLWRYLIRVRSPGTSGNKADYRNWALEVPGVGDVQVIPTWNGPGTVKVVLLDGEKQPADPEVVTAVQNYISPVLAAGEGKAPIGADITCSAGTAVNINVKAVVTRTGIKSMAEIQAAFETALADYLKSIAFTVDPTVRYVRIGSFLLDTNGVQDYSGLTIWVKDPMNGGTGNIPIAAGEVAVKGTVILSE